MGWFGIGFTLFFPALLVVVTYLLVRIALASRHTNRTLEQTNQKLERVVAELRMMRLRQLGEAPAEPSATMPKIAAPAETPAATPKIAAPTEPAAATAKSARPTVPPAATPKQIAAPPAPPVEVFAADVKCYYCGGDRPLMRYLGQPICATCRQNALLKDEPAAR